MNIEELEEDDLFFKQEIQQQNQQIEELRNEIHRHRPSSSSTKSTDQSIEHIQPLANLPSLRNYRNLR